MLNGAKKYRRAGDRQVRSAVAIAAAATLLGLSGNAGAFQVDTGNEDLKVNWDNTVRYTYAYRTDKRDPAFIKNINSDDGDRNFGVGTVNNRLDLLSELGVSYKKFYGIKVSGAAWYDQAYDGGFQNPSVATSNHFVNGVQSAGLNDWSRRYFAGPSGELLDAFAYAKIDAGSVPVYVKVGRSTVYWGEGLLNPFHAISYGQMPLDLAKATALPGVEVKELFRPLNNVTVTAQPTDSLSVSGQYFLQWEEDRIPEAGTYFGSSDVVLRGGETLLFAPGGAPGSYLRMGSAVTPRQARDFGFNVRWSPDWLDGTVGLYYRNFSDKLPQVGLMLANGTYHVSYADGIQLFGLSIGKTIGGAAYSAEVSYRKDMPLASGAAMVTSLPGAGDTFGARGNTIHALVNGMFTLPNGSILGNKIWDLGVLLAEFDFSHLEKITSHPELFAGNAPGDLPGKPTRNFVGTTLSFTPTWYQVLPGVDLSMPGSFGIGLAGTSIVGNGGVEHAGSWSAGFEADIFQKYKASLKYTDYFGAYATDATGAEIATGGPADLRDRGFVSLTLKTTF